MLLHAHQAIEEILLMDLTESVNLCKEAKSIFYVGRGPFYAVALEGALKMKEISYIHAEGYAAGELKHGPFALLSPETPVIALCTPGETYGVMISNIKEMKARGAPVIAIGSEGDRNFPILSIFLSRFPGRLLLFRCSPALWCSSFSLIIQQLHWDGMSINPEILQRA